MMMMTMMMMMNCDCCSIATLCPQTSLVKKHDKQILNLLRPDGVHSQSPTILARVIEEVCAIFAPPQLFLMNQQNFAARVP